MISNSTSFKIKTSRGPGIIYDFENDQFEESFENNSNDGEVSVSNHRVQGYLRDSRFRNSSIRGRITEFRPSWNNERRGNFKTKSFPSRGRPEKDTSDFYMFNRKYDSSIRGNDPASSYQGKIYESGNKNDVKLNLPEDTRISKLLRNLSIETDQEASFSISKKLLEVLLLPDNAAYIRKAFHILSTSMFNILQVSPGLPAKKQAARALGRMGYIMGQENDFDRYLTCIFNKFSSSYDDMQILLIESFKETFDFEKNTPILQDHIDTLMKNLVTIIETVESAAVFKSILDVLMMVVEIYPDNFFPLFRDTIDLLFGWHVDHTQPLNIIEFISRSLQRIPKHFQFYSEFSISLLENFLEDIVNYSKQLEESGEAVYLEHITVLVLALNTVLKCLGLSIRPCENNNIKIEFINTLLHQVIKTATHALESYIPENLIIATNDCITLVLVLLDTKSQSVSNSIYDLVEMELMLVNDLCDATIISMLYFISKILKELSANLPVELIEKLVGPKSEIVKLRNSPFQEIQEAVICVYQALFNLKNVSLVQEAYRYILGDLEVVYKVILPHINDFSVNNPFKNSSEKEITLAEAQVTTIFILRCLSQLANASSIIVMWALKPSILELVAINLMPYDPLLAKYTPGLQYSLIYLLYSHCKCYNHYISTSSLIIHNEKQGLSRFLLADSLNKDDVPTSPNSKNLGIILDLIYKTLASEPGYEAILLILQWLKDILIKSEMYIANLYDKKNFILITEALVKCGYSLNEQVVLNVCENLEQLLINKQLAWSNTFLTKVSDLCKLHINSNVDDVRTAYSKLSCLIPWDVALVEFNKVNSISINIKQQYSSLKDYSSYMVTMAQYLHLTGAISSELSAVQFKKFMHYLLSENADTKIHLQEIFMTCLSFDSQSQMNMELFHDLGLNSKILLHKWMTLESAKFCVSSKLRTPLGKPYETFRKIESSFNQLGNELLSSSKGKIGLNNHDTVRIRVKMLLQFIEHLEKCIYNASEGCAIAMPQANKSVKSFFIANNNTCNEWLSRIRMVIIYIALNASEYNTAVRHGFALLKELEITNKINSAEFERATIFTTSALIHLKETESIYGLYIWCKSLQDKKTKKYLWIKCAAEQSSKKYEMAIEGYKKILDEDQSKNNDDEQGQSLEKDTRQFIYDQIYICLREFHNWSEIKSWQQYVFSNHEEDVNKCNKYPYLDWNITTNLANLEENTFEIKKLSDWTNEPSSWSSDCLLSTVENNFYGVAINLSTENVQDNCKEIVISSFNSIEKLIQNNLESIPSDIFQNFLLYQYIGNGLHNLCTNQPANTVLLVSENFENKISTIDSSILGKILWWSEYFGRVQNQGFNVFCNNLRLHIIKRARKEKNLNLASKNIYKFLREKEILIIDDKVLKNNLASCFIQKIPELNVWSLDIGQGVMEIIKLLYTVEENKIDTFNLCAATSTSISKYTELYGGVELKKISSKILLKLANWMQSTENVPITDLMSPLGKLLVVLPEIPMLDNNPSGIIPLNEMAIGKLLQFSLTQYSNLAKGWSAFGTWCYKWGKKILDCSNTKITLIEEDLQAIRNLLPSTTSDSDINKIVDILSQTRNKTDDEDLDSSTIQTSAMIKNQLQNIEPLQNADEKLLMELVQIWKNIQKRIYNYYNLCADAYFKYLHLAVNSENMKKSIESNSTTITLRLLRLIVKYALELQQVLEEGLRATPTQPWKVIIPQLFSRLNHPESYVNHCVSDLLCRIAEEAPHLITFPVVVGALEGGLKINLKEISLPNDYLSETNVNSGEDNENNDDEDVYESDVEEVSNSLQSSFKTMVDALSKQDPDTISQVQMLVKELKRITILWDELWLGTLMQYHNEINKRQEQLEVEIEKVNENQYIEHEEKVSLIAEKHRIIIKPIIFILEQLRDVTNVEAETPHEKQFQEKFSADIDDVILKLKQPENPEKPSESLLPLKMLQKKFQQKVHKRSSYSLIMEEISPLLANIRDTLIAMPGINCSKSTVKISHVCNIVSILPTKTKPKKLIFYGSDGQTYTYLFKGLEDLHLDERIMQFLSIANTMMAQTADLTSQNLYRARHYSVIPLGPRSGLISWVDGTTPVFLLYKRWHQREQAKLNAKNGSNANPSVLRPSELFYNKLNPLLTEHGVKNIENRKEWPPTILKQVLTELMAETPKDLLTKELWCNSISANDWWNISKRYSYSVAVMSIIGYIIGLGDRHLDNMLVDLTSGEVVHIDYNVCFEKGKTLRVPEKVPFRLTPNIKDAFGITGVEGIFRLACENVLKTLRKGRETLLTLLEAFVYDPLIDWTVGEVLAGTAFGNVSTNKNIKLSRKELEKEITISMFNVRCTEMRTEWNDNKKEICATVLELKNLLVKWLEIDKTISGSEDTLQDLHQQMALVKEAEAHGTKHALYCLPSKYESYQKMKDTASNAKQDLTVIMQECESHLKSYGDALISLDGPEFLQWMLDLKEVANIEKISIFDLVKEFLHKAGKDDIISQCEESELEVNRLTQQYIIAIQKCIQLLQDYKLLLGQCPKSFLDKHRCSVYLKWASLMLSNDTVECCDLIYENLHAFLDPGKQQKQNIAQFMINLDTFYKETTTKMNKLCEELSAVNGEIPNLDKIYGSARSGISSFLGSEKQADKAFQFVITTELLILNKNFITLETAAHRSGEWLIKLTSRDGDWFLDDLVLNSTKAVELMGNITLQPNEDHTLFYQLFNCIRISNNVYRGLYELYFNFHTIIFPETMKKLQSEDLSVLQMISDLNQLILSTGLTIPAMIMQLSKILPCLLMQIDVNPSLEYVLERISVLKTGFFHIINDQSEGVTSGKMLLMGFNGLFEKLTSEWKNLAGALSSLNIPNSWKKVDQVKEAKTISPQMNNIRVQSLLEDIFLLKRLQAMIEFFNLCAEMCHSFKGVVSVAYPDDQLIKPVRQFIADFISKQLLGITTENIAYVICYLLQNLGFDVLEEIEQRDIGAESKVPIDDIYHKAWNIFLKQLFSQNALSQASTLETNLKHAWSKIQMTKKIQEKITMLQSTQLRLHTQIAVQNFMFEEILIQFNLSNPVRSKFLAELKNEIINLNNLHGKLIEAVDKQEGLVKNAHQRLNWAKGANPNVCEISSAFADMVKLIDNKLKNTQTIGGKIMHISSSILKHEQLRVATSESKELDQQFLNCFDKWSVVCNLTNLKNDSLSATEESLMNYLDNELSKDPNWLEKVSEKITDLITNSQNKLSNEKISLFSFNDLILTSVESLKSAYMTHCRLMTDIKNLIKNMTKIENYSEHTQKFVGAYRIYIDKLSYIVKNLKKEMRREDVAELLGLASYICENTEKIYSALLNLEGIKNEPIPISDIGVLSKDSPHKLDGAVKGQQKNAYAINVWRRVKLKLEGRDPDPGQKYTTQEQVDYVIREATSLDNLALLYEGWTPWV